MFDVASIQHTNSISCLAKFLTVSNFDILHLLQATSSKMYFDYRRLMKKQICSQAEKKIPCYKGQATNFSPQTTLP